MIFLTRQFGCSFGVKINNIWNHHLDLLVNSNSFVASKPLHHKLPTLTKCLTLTTSTDASENYGFTPKSSIFIGCFHYYKPSILGAHPYFWKHLVVVHQPPLKKYERRIGSFPQISGVKITKDLSCHHHIIIWETLRLFRLGSFDAVGGHWQSLGGDHRIPSERMAKPRKKAPQATQQ